MSITTISKAVFINTIKKSERAHGCKLALTRRELTAMGVDELKDTVTSNLAPYRDFIGEIDEAVERLKSEDLDQVKQLTVEIPDETLPATIYYIEEN